MFTLLAAVHKFKINGGKTAIDVSLQRYSSLGILSCDSFSRLKWNVKKRILSKVYIAKILIPSRQFFRVGWDKTNREKTESLLQWLKEWVMMCRLSISFKNNVGEILLVVEFKWIGVKLLARYSSMVNIWYFCSKGKNRELVIWVWFSIFSRGLCCDVKWRHNIW